MNKTSQVGKEAEELAVKFLRKNRYKILERNFELIVLGEKNVKEGLAKMNREVLNLFKE